VSEQNRGFLRREDYYTRIQVATKKRKKPAILLGEINTRSSSSHHNPRIDRQFGVPGFEFRVSDSSRRFWFRVQRSMSNGSEA